MGNASQRFTACMALGVVAVSRGLAGRQNGVDLGELISGETDLESTHVFVEITEPLGSWNGHNVWPLGQHPCERELAGRAPLGRWQAA